MPTNFYMIFIVALIPVLLSIIYYNPKVMGGLWMQSNGVPKSDIQQRKMPLVLGLLYLLSCFLAFALPKVVIHQTGVFSMMMPDVLVSGSQAQ